MDQERNTIINAYKYAFNDGQIDANPAKELPRFQPSSDVKHCREFCPQTADELHEIAKLFFVNRKSEVLRWQLLFEAMTGLRTEEVVAMRMDAKPGQLGHVRSDGNMDVGRVKKGANPFVFIHVGFKEVLKAHAVWHAARYPNSPWYFPGREESALKPVGKRALAHRLGQLRGKIGRKITSHGMRAFYVLIRRSQGVSDAIIAWEIGHTSGGAVIESTYGSAPLNWQNGGGPNLKWLPNEKLAWKSIKPIDAP
ncbi:MAG: site-specific integrase [Verrucomicrobia bacterium]|nr:site-specific integrase [Verrucomicrobiota bacterium]